MNINFELYRVFYAVANVKNISKAAEELNISQPAISKSIKNLEQSLGGKLFIRTRRGVELTDEGKEFHRYISEAIEYIHSAENKFNDLINLQTGTIKIGVSVTLTKKFLLPYIEEFHKKYPKIDIQIVTNLVSDLIPKLKSGLIDIIILNYVPEFMDKDVEIIKCKEIQDCFCANDNFKDLKGKKISLKDLNNYPLILQTKESNTRKFVNIFSEQNDTILKPTIELASYSLVEEFTKIGLGIGYITKEYIEKELQSGELFEISLKERIPTRYIAIAISKKYLPSFRAKKLIEIIKT